MSARTRTAGIAALAALLAGGAGVGVGWHVTDNGTDHQQPAAADTATPDPTGKRAGEMPPPMHTPEAEPPPVEYEPIPELASLYDECANGYMYSCDALWELSPLGSEEERFADTCGDTQPPGSSMICYMFEPEDPSHPQDMTERVSTFGETYEWETGLSVTVSEPETFEPSETAAYDQAETYIRYDVTIVNNTDQVYDAFEYMSSMLSGGAAGSITIDTAAGLEGTPSVALHPGQEVTFTEGYGVADPEDLSLSVAPDWDSVEWMWATGGQS